MQYPIRQIAMLAAWTLVTSFAWAQAGSAPMSSATQMEGRVFPPFSLSAKGDSLLVPRTPTPTLAPPTPAQGGGALAWYNGDWDGVEGLSNEQDTSIGSSQFAHTYDDFNVTDSGGWDVTAVFSNNLTDTNITGATWEIRQGISPGNSGTLIASGMTATPLVTATGRSGFGYNEYSVEVVGIYVYLPPGNGYFLNVTPIGDLSGRSFVSTTSGANAVGQPPGNNQNAFFDSNFFGAVFQSTADLGQPYDYSMGVKIDGEDKLALQSAFSRKRHGAAGVFDLPLPFTGAEGIESRAGGGDLIYLTYNHNLIGAGSVVSSCGSASVSLDPKDTKNLIVTVQGRSCDAMNITFTVDGILDDQGETGTATLTYGKLIGDVDGNSVVNLADLRAIRALAPAPVDSSNFRADLNLDGNVTSRDRLIAQSHRGEKLP